MEKHDLVIVGAGPTGLFATFCAGLRDIESLTLESLDTPGGQIPKFYPIKMVYDMAGIPGIEGKDLAEALYKQAQLFHAKIVTNSKVTDVKQNQDGTFTLEVNGQPAYTSKSVLLTTGIGSLTPKKMKVDGEDQYAEKGVYYSITSMDVFKGKRVAVVGGGDAGFDSANQVSGVAQKIYVLEYSEVIRAAERDVEELKSTGKAQILTNSAVQKVIGDGSKVTQLLVINRKTNETTTLDVDVVVVAIGHNAEPHAFKSLNLETFMERYVKVTDDFQTSVKGVFAAGDVCQTKNAIKLGLLAVGAAEAYAAVDNVKKYLNPNASMFGQHSTNLNLGAQSNTPKPQTQTPQQADTPIIQQDQHREVYATPQTAQKPSYTAGDTPGASKKKVK